LKPIYGKPVYDRFIAANPFISRFFPNFDPATHREVYPELTTSWTKRLIEGLLQLGPVQVLERITRFVLGRYLSSKVNPHSDVQMDRRRLKLHLYSHKKSVLDSAAMRDRKAGV